MVVPILYLFFRKMGRSRNNLIIVTLIILSASLNYYRKGWAENYYNPVFWKIISVSIFPYFWNFGIGMLININWDNINKLFLNRFFHWLILYLIIILSSVIFNFIYLETYLYYILCIVLLSCLVISFAFSLRHLSKYLYSNDISYGIYIYHMPITNFFIIQWGLGKVNNLYSFFLILVFVFITSYLSWKLIESPSLKLKKYIPIYS
jgi:peptidoglycan/LPS O-acetylase OafA/YrhL